LHTTTAPSRERVWYKLQNRDTQILTQKYNAAMSTRTAATAPAQSAEQQRITELHIWHFEMQILSIN